MDTSITEEEEAMLTEEEFQQLYTGLPNIPTDAGWRRTWIRFCTTLASGAQWFSDAIWVARNGDKEGTCFALASQGYDPSRRDIETAHPVLQASARWRSSPEGERSKTLLDMALDIKWAASKALENELHDLILQENIPSDNGAGHGSILSVLLSNNAGASLEHRSKITSLMAIIYASEIISFNTASQYTGGPQYIATQVTNLLGRDAAQEYRQLVTTKNDLRYINVMYGWLFALIFDRNPLNAPVQDIVPFPTNMWAISYLAMRLSSQDSTAYGHTLITEMARADGITNRSQLSDALVSFFALYNRSGTPAGSYSRDEIITLVASFPDEPFPLSEINMGQWMTALSDEIKADCQILTQASSERLAGIQRSSELEKKFLSGRVGKPVASMDTLDQYRSSIVNPGERVDDLAVGSSQDPFMFGDKGHISEQMKYDEIADEEAEKISLPSQKSRFPSKGYMAATGKLPFYQQLDFSRGRPSQASPQIVSASSSRPTQTSQGTLLGLQSPNVPYATPYPNEMSRSSSAGPPPPHISIGDRVETTVKNRSSSNADYVTINGTAVYVGTYQGKTGVFVGICLDETYRDYGKHDCDGACPEGLGIYVPIAKVRTIQSSSSSSAGDLLDLNFNHGGRRYKKTRKIKRTRKTKKVMKKMKKSKKSRRSKK